MEDRLTNSINMINTTTKFSDDNATVTAGMAAFGTAVTAVKAKIVLINGMNQIGGGSTKGVTLDTNVLRTAMEGYALKCARGTLAYANSVNNNTLKALVNFSASKLAGLKKEDVDDVCQGIRDAAHANIVAVGPFGIVAMDVTDLQTSIDLFRTATQNPRNAIITRTQANRQAKVMVRDIVDTYLVGQMDPIVDTLKLTNVDFWKAYREARVVVNLGSTTAKVRGTTKDVNDVPIVNATFTIYKTGLPDKVKEVSSDIKGKFNAAGLPSGNFDFKWEKPGYTTVMETNVHIGPGKELKRTVVMTV